MAFSALKQPKTLTMSRTWVLSNNNDKKKILFFNESGINGFVQTSAYQ